MLGIKQYFKIKSWIKYLKQLDCQKIEQELNEKAEDEFTNEVEQCKKNIGEYEYSVSYGEDKRLKNKIYSDCYKEYFDELEHRINKQTDIKVSYVDYFDIEGSIQDLIDDLETSLWIKVDWQLILAILGALATLSTGIVSIILAIKA